MAYLRQAHLVMTFFKNDSTKVIFRAHCSWFMKHKIQNIQFILMVDDFGIKYTMKDDLDHLIHTLEKHYDVTLNLDSKGFIKIELDWDYNNSKVHLSIKPYLNKALCQFDNIIPSKHHDMPYPHISPNFGKAMQYIVYDTSPYWRQWQEIYTKG